MRGGLGRGEDLGGDGELGLKGGAETGRSPRGTREIEEV